MSRPCCYGLLTAPPLLWELNLFGEGGVSRPYSRPVGHQLATDLGSASHCIAG
ncbi:hypothetical protein ACT3TY_14475 [Halomonas sp. AOP22-C1-8]|uniref:hypothetical protein n=1 Tax=Halomonas sp. AOP22-C1-8 TaxID=3457717 RepID=UPI0040334D1D